jgi:phage-related baseplate assembly protein
VSSLPGEGAVSVAVVPASGGLPDAPLLDAVAQRLDERKLVGTRVVVRPPQYTSVNLNVALVVRPNTVEQSVLQAAMAAVTGFFDPLRGGPGLDGWPFGRPVSIYELYRLIEAVPGVDHVDRIELNGDPDTREVPVEDLPALAGLVITAVNGS